MAALSVLLACNGTPQPEPDRAAPDPAASEQAEPPPPPPERWEIVLRDPAMPVVLIEQELLLPVADELRALTNVRELVVEAEDGLARFEVTIDRGSAELVKAKLDALAPKLAPSVSPAVLSRPATPDAPFVRWALAAEPLDMLVLARVHAELLRQGLALQGVVGHETCAPQRRLVIELEAELVNALGLGVGEIEKALRLHVLEQPPNASLEQLRGLVIGGTATQPVRLGDVAALRYGFGPPTCVAAGAHGLAASATFTLADDEARVRLELLLETFALPAGVQLHRFSSADTVVELSVDPQLPLEQVAETIGRGLSRESSAWLVEVGLGSAPCMRDGTHVRLSLRGSGRADAGSLASFRSIPGVTRVWSSADPDTRYVWLTGSNPAGLRDHAVQLQSKSADVRALLDVPESELAITPDRERLAALGIPVADFAVQLQLARVGVELGQLLDDAGVLPVWLRLGDGEVSIYELRELVLQAPDQRQVALGSLAELRMIETEPARCRHADRPAVLLAVRAATWAQLARELPASLSWSWRD